MLKSIKISFLCGLFVILAGCVSKNTDENNEIYLDSAAVTTKIHAKLFSQLGPQATSIKVKTYRDEVQLTGQVDTVALQKQAGEIVASIRPIQHVRNDLIVK